MDDAGSIATALRGGTLLTPTEVLHDHVLVLEGERIAALTPVRAAPARTAGDLDASDCWVVPGYVDIHVHGGNAHDTMDASPEALRALSSHLAGHGVTAFLATTVTAARTAIDAAVAAVGAAADGLPGARVLGAHLEGPYLNPEHRGAQDPDELRLPDPAEYGPWLDSGTVRLITLAPELDGALELIATARARGVELSAGHCGADDAALRAAIDAGLRHATHTFNGMAPLHHRAPGALGVILTDDRIYAELIADGVHVHPTVMSLLVRAKGAARSVLVSDAIRATGMPDGTYALGGQQVTVRNGVCRIASGGLAGSTLTLDRAVANLVRLAGVPLQQAVTMATASPAASLGLEGHLGTLTPGSRADVTVLDERLQVRATLVGGRIVYQRAEG